MIDYRNHLQMGRGIRRWLDNTLHFSFADYADSRNPHYGILRVANDALVAPGTGFAMHSHQDMEILTYVIDGTLTHTDGQGNEKQLTRGQAQVITAGSGYQHSEYNHGDTPLRYIQLWMYPDQAGLTPECHDAQPDFTANDGVWTPVAAGTDLQYGMQAPLSLHADASVFATMMPEKTRQMFFIEPDRQVYFILLEGDALVCGQQLRARDAMKIEGENVWIQSHNATHALLIEMQRA